MNDIKDRLGDYKYNFFNFENNNIAKIMHLVKIKETYASKYCQKYIFKKKMYSDLKVH